MWLLTELQLLGDDDTQVSNMHLRLRVAWAGLWSDPRGLPIGRRRQSVVWSVGVAQARFGVRGEHHHHCYDVHTIISWRCMAVD